MELLPDLLESVARLRVKVAGTFKGARREVNFTSSDSSVTITGTDDSVNERMTVDLTGAGGPGATLWHVVTGTIEVDETKTSSASEVSIDPTNDGNVSLALTDNGGGGTGQATLSSNGNIWLLATEHGVVSANTSVAVNSADVTITSSFGTLTLSVVSGNLVLSGLPTSNPAVTGAVWSDNGVLVQGSPTFPAPSGSAGGALDGTYPNPGLASSVAGDGLAETSDVLSVNVDGSTIETSSDALRLKDGGTTNAKLANMAQSTVKGRAAAAGSGVPVDLSATQVRTIVDTNTTPSTQAIGDSAVVGTTDTLARGDHKHAMPAYGTTAATITQGNDSRLSDARAPLGQPLDPGTFTLATEQFVIQYGHLKLAGSERYTMADTARVVLTDLHAQDSIILGTPKQPTQSFTVPNDWSLDQMFRLSLVNNMRATLQGTADLILTDDFKQRSRLVLS